MAKFDSKKLGKVVYLKIASERVIFKATGEPYKTKKGYLAIPIKIYAGTFVDLNGKKHTGGTGSLLLPGFISHDQDFITVLEERKIIGIKSNKRNEKYYADTYSIIENMDDIKDFMKGDEEEGEEVEDGEEGGKDDE